MCLYIYVAKGWPVIYPSIITCHCPFISVSLAFISFPTPSVSLSLGKSFTNWGLGGPEVHVKWLISEGRWWCWKEEAFTLLGGGKKTDLIEGQKDVSSGVRAGTRGGEGPCESSRQMGLYFICGWGGSLEEECVNHGCFLSFSHSWLRAGNSRSLTGLHHSYSLGPA